MTQPKVPQLSLSFTFDEQEHKTEVTPPDDENLQNIKFTSVRAYR